MRIGLDDENSRMLPRFIQHEQARAPRYGDLGCGRAARAPGRRENDRDRGERRRKVWRSRQKPP